MPLRWLEKVESGPARRTGLYMRTGRKPAAIAEYNLLCETNVPMTFGTR